LTIFLLPSRIFPTGFFNSCALFGHSGFGGGGGDAGDSGVFGDFVSGGIIGGGGGDSVVISNLFGS